MQRRLLAVVSLSSLAAIGLGIGGGNTGALTAYLVVGTLSLVANLHAAHRVPEFATSFRLMSGLVASFMFARLSEGLDVSSGVANFAYSVSYLVTAICVASLVRLRVRRIQVASVLEAVLVTGGVFLVSLLLQSLVPAASLSGPIVSTILVTTFLISVAFLGRASAGPAWRLWFVSVILAFVLEMAYGARDVSAIASWVTTYLASAPLLVLTLAALLREPLRHTNPDEMLVRRPIGRRQLLATFVVVLLPPIVLVSMATTGESPHRLLYVLGTAVTTTAVVVWRFDLLVRDRDLSFHNEEVLRNLAERLVRVTGRKEALEACARTIGQLGSGGGSDVRLEVDGTTVFVLRDGVLEAEGQGLTMANENDPVTIDFDSISSGRFMVSDSCGESLRRSVATTDALLQLTFDSLDHREQTHQQRADARFRALVQDSNDVVALVGIETGNVELISPTVERLFGYRESEYLGSSPLQHLLAEDRSKVEAELRADDELDALDVRIQHADGEFRWFDLSVRELSPDDEISGRLYSFADIHDRKMAELQVLSSESRYRALVSNASDVFALIDADERITFVSHNVTRLLGFRPEDLVGTQVRSLLTERGSADLHRALERFDHLLEGETIELRLRTQDGDERIGAVAFSDPSLGGSGEMLVTVHDLTEQRRLEESLRNQALHDPLTGLFNRASLYPELQRSLQRLAVGETLGVLHLNVREFKAVNESLGFATGDELLIAIATRLRASLRGNDTIARLGADEFAIITAVRDRAGLDEFADRLLRTFDERFDIDDRQIAVDACLGLISTSDRRSNATTLLENVALAVREARTSDRSIVVFDEKMRIEAAERYELASEILGAIDDGQFGVVYQPVFELDSNRVSSVEALLRWTHPRRGPVSPGVFIPLAEHTGAIVELGRWVLREACGQLATWHGNLAGGKRLGMAVNLSARQLEVAGEVQRLLDIIDESGVSPAALTIELTESTLIEDADWLRGQLEEFRALGIRIAVDDFGTGAAGIGHLRDVPFDILKVDKSYVDNIGVTEEASNLVSGVVELAHSMRTKLVAEGIENPVQAALLKELNCDYGQGFYLGRPMDPVSLERWFAEGRAGSTASLILNEPSW